MSSQDYTRCVHELGGDRAAAEALGVSVTTIRNRRVSGCEREAALAILHLMMTRLTDAQRERLEVSVRQAVADVVCTAYVNQIISH